jgi:hypothetical protein
MPTPDLPARPRPVEGLYAVRDHLAIVNGIVVASATLVAVLDFLAPRLSLAPVIVYSMTACLTTLLALAAAAPRLAGRLMSAAGGAAGPGGLGGSAPLWSRPAWQAAFAILLGVSIVGFSSVAKASQGGLIASRFPAARSLQESLLGLRADVAEIGRGVDSANGKLDILVGDSRDPQKELAARGYAYDDGGLSKAIRQGDRRAVGLFAKAGYKAAYLAPIGTILNGGQPWDAELVSLLPAAMFADKSTCAQGGLLNGELRKPAAARIAQFKRLCDPGPWIAMLRRNVAQDRLTPSPNDQWTRQRAARVSNLAALAG